MTQAKKDESAEAEKIPGEIKLSKPIVVDGQTIHVLMMREPTVADQLAMDKAGGSDADKELSMIAMLCMLKPSDLHQMTLKDYKKATATFLGFID